MCLALLILDLWGVSGSIHVKVHPGGSIDCYKVRLVALGNHQEHGVNYEETFAPVAKMSTIRTIHVIYASQNWPLIQTDVKNMFLHGGIQEEIFMHVPQGLYSP